jgi:hypothetical protein
LNRLRQGPAKELLTSLFRVLWNRLTPTLFEYRLELTAVSAIVFFLGLLFGFQRPSRLWLPRLVCYRTSTSRLLPVQLRGRLLYFEAALLSSGRCRFAAASPRLESTPRRCALFLPVEGARNLLRFRFPCQLASSTLFPPRPDLSPVRLRRFEGRRLLPPPRWESTSLADFVFRLSLLRPGPPSPVRLRLSVRGARLLPPPRWESTAFIDSPLPTHLASSPLRLPPCRGRGFYHRRVESQLCAFDSVFLLSAAASPSHSKGAASTTAALGVNNYPRIHHPAGSAWCARHPNAAKSPACDHRRVGVHIPGLETQFAPRGGAQGTTPGTCFTVRVETPELSAQPRADTPPYRNGDTRREVPRRSVVQSGSPPIQAGERGLTWSSPGQ